MSKEQNISGTERRRFLPYPEYKDSGVEWLGQIPAQWKSNRLKYLCRRSALYGANEPTESYVDDGVRFLRTSDIDDEGRLLAEGAVYLSRQMISEYILKSGDLLISRSGTLGRTLHYQHKLHGECAYAGYLVRFEPSSELYPQFAYYFTKSLSFQQWLSFSAIKSTIGNINGQKYANMSLPVPQIEEQRIIAAFLDQETAKIDTFIAKKERLIELLQEKRTALITQAVTKGLDPNVPMKDSGVEWLGKIPTHWAVMQLKHLVPEITVGIVVTPAKYYVDDGIPCLRSLNISQGEVHMDDLVFISEEANELHRKSKIFEDDIVVVRTGQAGTATVIPTQLDGANCIDLLIIRHSDHLMSKFIYYYLNSEVAISQADVLSVGAIQAHYNTATLANLLVPTLSLMEQEKVVSYLDEKTKALDLLANKIVSAINHLREYRTALISAAVTGKIDVQDSGLTGR